MYKGIQVYGWISRHYKVLYTENVARERQTENFQNVGGKGEYGRYIKRPKSRKGENATNGE